MSPRKTAITSKPSGVQSTDFTWLELRVKSQFDVFFLTSPDQYFRRHVTSKFVEISQKTFVGKVTTASKPSGVQT